MRAAIALLTLAAACAGERPHPVVPMEPRPEAEPIVAGQCFAACLVASIRGTMIGSIDECQEDCSIGAGLAPACELERATGERKGICR